MGLYTKKTTSHRIEESMQSNILDLKEQREKLITKDLELEQSHVSNRLAGLQARLDQIRYGYSL
jgi:hypothetical protein